MSLNPKLSSARRTAALDTALDVLNGGNVLVLDGTQATDADTAIGSQVTLVQIGMNATAWAAASSASKSANAFTSATISASGTTTWYRMRTSGSTAVWDGSCGTSSANLVWNSVALSSGASAQINSFTATMAP